MAITHDLPHQSTPFIGRSEELAEIAALLGDPACRLLTLAGPGGIGKTRLALEVAAVQLEKYLDGVYFIPLQPLTSPDFIVPALAEAIQFQFYSGGEPKQQLLDYLREKSLLLILDNFEHLLDGVELVSEILGDAPHVKVLVTSRERLNLREEWALEVQGLAVPTSADSEITEYSAVQLFLQNARRVQVGFAMTDSEKPAVTHICQLVGGMPLGIELASTWVRALSCKEIAAEIERSLDILATSTRNVPPRHRNMRAVLEHSWTLLTDTERDVFKKLCIFRGGYRKEAAQSVAGATLQTLSALVDKSLLRVNASGRYDIHELMRHFGEEQLNIVPEELEQTRDHHSAYYATFMYHQNELMYTHSHHIALHEIETEIDNMRSAWRWMVERRKVDEIQKSINCMALFLAWHHRYQEGLDLFGQAADALRPLSLERKAGIAYGYILAEQSHFYNDISDAERAKALAEESLAIMRRFDTKEGIMAALGSLALTYMFLGYTKEWERAYEEGLRIARETGDPLRIAGMMAAVAKFVGWRHDYIQATQMLTEGLSIAEQLDSPLLISDLCTQLGQLAVDQGDYTEAQRRLEEGLRINQEMGNVHGVALSYMYLAEAATVMKDFARARDYFRQELEIDVEVGSRRWQTDTIVKITRLLMVQDEKEWAIELLTLISQHPGTMPGNRDEAEQKIAELQAELAPDVFAAALERGRARDLDSSIKELMAAFTQPVKPAKQRFAVPPHKDSLTERELEILRLIAEGLSNREIAERLFLTTGTVKVHISNIYSKLAVNSRTEAVAHARVLNLL